VGRDEENRAVTALFWLRPWQFAHLLWADSAEAQGFCTAQDVLTAILTPSQLRSNFH
jgi:hypothetical protein